jgi:crotonobetainyl-CoA:carnitine CoA-transferase CaiB-like acyl-CoA transferase
MSSTSSSERPAGVLAGTRVIDLGRYIAGPMCAAMLGDLGADVIRVERVSGGDDRYQYLTGPNGDNGACFLHWNRNKKSLTLDPLSPEGKAILARLVRTADVVVVNLPVETLRQMGVDYASLRDLRPDIILVHVTGFGPRGPYADRLGFDGVGQSMSGMVYLSGLPGEPMKSYASWVDCSTAMFSAYGALAAILHRRATGQGQLVETNLLRSALNVSSFLIAEQALTGVNRVASGNRSQSSCPADLVRTQDGWILVQCVGNPLYRRWARLMGEEHWLTDPRFKDDDSRAKNGEILSERTREWAAGRTTAQALAELATAKIPAGPMLSPQQVLDDPHVQAGGYLQELDYPGVERPVPYVTPGAELSVSPATIRFRAPTIGEHTAVIMRELGYTDADIDALRERRVI